MSILYPFWDIVSCEIAINSLLLPVEKVRPLEMGPFDLGRRRIPSGRRSALVIQMEAAVVREVLRLIDAAVRVDRVDVVHGGGRRIRLRLQRQRRQRVVEAGVGDRAVGRVLVAQRVGQLVGVGRRMEVGERFAVGHGGGRVARRHRTGRRHRVVVVHGRGVAAVRRHQVRERIGLLRVAVQQELVVEGGLAAGRCGQRAG